MAGYRSIAPDVGAWAAVNPFGNFDVNASARRIAVAPTRVRTSAGSTWHDAVIPASLAATSRDRDRDRNLDHGAEHAHDCPQTPSSQARYTPACRLAPGGLPITRLNARLNAACDAYPSRSATVSIGSLSCVSHWLASRIRSSVA